MFLPAWAVDGSKVPASMARRESYNRSGGKGGVTRAADLEVVELPTPGTAVRIMPGGATIQNTYPGVSGQAYGIANDAAFDLAVPATGSGSGATRYVIVRIDDPEFGGQNPAEPLTAPYNYPTLVSSITSLAYPFEVLAKITQPASTATITQSLITDMRRLANPGYQPEQILFSLSPSGTETLTATASKGEVWPNSGGVRFLDIPEWTTHVQVRAEWASVLMPPGSTYGMVWMEFGPSVETSVRQYSTSQYRFDSPNAAGNTRQVLVALDTVPVDPSIRGTNQQFVLKGRIDGGSNPARPVVDYASGTSISVVFKEQI